MSVLESTDRRSQFADYATWIEEAHASYPEVRDASITHRYFLGETLTSAHLENVRCDGLGIFECVFEGGIWREVQLGASEVVNTVFRHCYFEKVDFSATQGRGLRFEHCVFNDCALPASEAMDAPTFVACLRPQATAAAPVPTPVRAVAAEQLPAAAVATGAARPADRFAELER